MERLTQRLRTGEVLMASDYEEKYTEQEWISVLQDRLAAYEDTGLEPEEVSDAVVGSKLLAKSQLVSAFGVAAERLRELAEADKDGRAAKRGNSVPGQVKLEEVEDNGTMPF